MDSGVLRAVTSGHGGGDEAVMAAANPNNNLGIRPFAGALVLVAKCSGYPLVYDYIHTLVLASASTTCDSGELAQMLRGHVK